MIMSRVKTYNDITSSLFFRLLVDTLITTLIIVKIIKKKFNIIYKK